ncbi:helix-turn-helix domain-containing protein, partial [Lactobacillus nasalidis]
MINIEKFIKIRKSLKLSQNELCRGICTQSTLSKFENNGQIPSFKILKQLCERMNISLSDIMLTSTESEIAQKLFSADFCFITYDYEKVRRILKQVNEKKIRDKQDLLHYNYLCGQLALDGDRDEVSALFYFNNILTTDNLKANNIYRLLALKGCSQVYASQDMNKASHYFDQILGEIKKVEIKDSLRELQVMSVLTAAGEFYGQNGQYKHADDLLTYAYDLASEHHVVYFLA